MIALLAGTDDPDREVREVCVRKLGQLADPATLPVLVEELVQVLEGKSPLSVRTLKSALIQFDLDEMDAFREALVHPNRRVRFFATDIIREVSVRHARKEELGKNDFSPEMYRLFTEVLWKDEWADVRARAAPVIVYFNDATSVRILSQLLEDEVWFVRLHTCRAITNRFYISLVPELAKRLTDTNWLVREAAVHSLGQMGDVGINESFRAFLTTRDTYAAEQIAENLQRDGTLVSLLSSLTQISSDQDYQRARAVARRMIQLGKTTLLQSYLVVPSPRQLKLMLIDELSGSISASYLQVLQACSESDEDPEVRNAATGVFQSAASLLLRQQKA
jgi:HEAT repeat protein